MLRTTTVLVVLFLLATTASPQTHTHGDQVGSLTPTSAMVWTRTSAAALVSIRYGTSPSLSGASVVGPVPTNNARDFIAKITLTGLIPGTQYYFASVVANPAMPQQSIQGATGRFRTPPRSGTSAPVKFVFSGDIRVLAEFDMFEKMRQLDPDFFVCLGDFPYADGATTVPDYWQKHKTVRNEPRLWRFLREVPIIGVWDDHEVVNNWDANTNPTLVANGKVAWKHYFPVPDALPEIYRKRSWGDTLDVFLLDTRSHRSVNSAPDLPNKRMLGAAQVAWLQGELARSTALFKVIVTSVPLRYGGNDAWAGYRTERKAITDFIVRQNIANVFFIAADRHWAASSQLREGLNVFQTGPLATSIGSPPAFRDPEVQWTASVRNYGLATIDPAASPPTLTMEWFDPNGRIRREVIEAATPAEVTVSCDMPEGAYALEDGPFFFRNSGTSVLSPRVAPGRYRVEFASARGAEGRPVSMDVTVPSGGRVAIAGDYHDTAPAANDVMLFDSFEQRFTGYVIHDEGVTSGPSSWYTDNGFLYQASNIHTAGTTADYPGTIATTGDVNWRDYTMHVKLRSRDNDGLGIVFRYRNTANYYRFSMDSQRQTRLLISRRNGLSRVLARDTVAYDPNRWYDVTAVAVGNRVRILVDGAVVFDVTDTDHPAGSVGLYSWANHSSLFDDLIVRRGDSSGLTRPTIARDDFNDGALRGWTIVDQGQTSGPSQWTETGGVLRQSSNINDSTSGKSSLPKLGTLALSNIVATNYDLDVLAQNGDNDAIGIVFRYRGPNDYYRFSLDAERRYQRLTRVAGGVWSVLWEDCEDGYPVGNWMRLGVRARGNRLAVLLDGRKLAEVTDATHVNGRVGFYTWASDAAAFDDFRLSRIEVPRPTCVAATAGLVTTLDATLPASAGAPYVVLLSFGRSPGIPLSTIDPADPRTLELNVDTLFVASLLGSPLFTGFQGTVSPAGAVAARIDWPSLPALRGLPVFAGGLVLPRSGGVGELIPTVQLIAP